MEIKEFVSTVIIDIVNGLTTANEALKNNESGAIVNPTTWHGGTQRVYQGSDSLRTIQQIEMSIAVTVSDARDSGGRLGLNVAGFSAEMNAAKSNTSNSSVSTVKFTVPIAFPVGQ